MKRIAIVDDEQRLADVLGMTLRRNEDYIVDVFYDPAVFVAGLTTSEWDLVITDLKMPNLTGVEVLSEVKAHSEHTAVVLITAHGTIEVAVEAMQLGAFDFIEKPFENRVVKKTVQNALRVASLGRENAFLRNEVRARYGERDVIAESTLMRDSLALAQRVAPTDSTVLILGESGTGKEVIAKTVHYYSKRVDGAFVPINCKSLSASVLESELFGHTKGAFTGAESDRVGWFQKANGGTIFLDEIGEIDLDFQGKLLRVLQEREVIPVGATAPIPFDARIIAATNKDLKAEVDAGRFREDLFYRLAVIPIQLAPLRERTADIIPLAEFFIGKIGVRIDRHSMVLGDEAKQFLMSHDWPGNVRELENTIERALVMAQSGVIGANDFMLFGNVPDVPMEFETLGDHLDRQTQQHIEAALALRDGKRGDAAQLLGIDRTTLYRLLKRFTDT